MTERPSLPDTKQLVDTYLQTIFLQRKSDATQISPSYNQLWQRIEQVVLQGGKRIRPYLTLVGYAKVDQAILPIAAAQELIHSAMLMHDDVIDQDFVRHGKKNVNGLYRDTYSSYLDDSRAAHYANSAGVLAGDALISESYRLLFSSGFTPDVTAKLSQQLFTSIYEVIGGELIDIEAAFVTDATYDPITVYRYKTAGYSFIGPLLSGAIAAGADEVTLKYLEAYAMNAGIAFQIQDDLLGVYGNEEATGKSTLTDLREAKQTLLVQFHKEIMDQSAAERFLVFGKKDVTDTELIQLKQDMIDSGAKDRVEAQAQDYFAKARQALNNLPDSERRTMLLEFTNWLSKRQL